MRRRFSKVRPLHEKKSRTFHNDKSINLKAVDHQKIEDSYSSADFVHRSEIKKRAIQVFYTEREDRKGDSNASGICALHKKVLHPNGSVRRIFDLITVIWVLILVFFIPFLIGFDWYLEPPGLNLFLSLLDVWFAIDILLNFRTGYIHHGTVIMTPQKIVW